MAVQIDSLLIEQAVPNIIDNALVHGGGTVCHTNL